MQLSSNNIFSHDVGKVIWGHLGKCDLVIAAGVCKAWRTVITADINEPYWQEALKFIAKPIKAIRSFEKFAKSISEAFEIHRNGLKQFPIQFLTAKPGKASEISEENRKIKEDSSKKHMAQEAITIGIFGAVTLYHADHLDFSVLESYMQKLSESYETFESAGQVAEAEYNKTTEVDFAKRWIVKIPLPALKYQLLDVIVKKHLAMQDLEAALEEIKPYRNTTLSRLLSFYKNCELIRDAAYIKGRLDIVEQLLDLISQPKRRTWVDLLIQKHKEAGNEAEALRIKKKFQ